MTTTEARDLTRLLLAHGPINYIPLAEAKQRYADFRARHGAARVCTDLLTKPEENSKFNKTAVAVYGLALAQADTAEGWINLYVVTADGDRVCIGAIFIRLNACRYSTRECRAGCVSTAGKGDLDSVKQGRVRKTLFLAEDPDAFCTLLMWEVGRLWAKHGIACRVRLDTFSDLPWELILPELFERYPLIRFYDYTAWPSDRRRELPPNYRLVRSAKETTTDAQVGCMLNAGPVAVVFSTKRGQALPTTFQGVPVIDGDKSDDRFHDGCVVVGLRAKGKMRKGEWGMVRKVS